jgi:hypothetical protein
MNISYIHSTKFKICAVNTLARVYLQKELTSTGIENENGSIDWFGSKISLKCLMDCHTIDIGVINKPNDLVAKKLSIVLR